MTSFDTAARQIAGALKMAFNVGDWKAELDRSIDGVFGSFAAFLFAAPLVALFTLSARRAAARVPDFPETLYHTVPLPALLAADLATYALDWGVSLALLVMLARAGGASDRAAELIVGYNWIQPVIAAAQLPPIALMASTVSAAAGGFLGLSAFILTAFLIWGIIRRGLGVPPAQAAAAFVALALIGIVIDSVGSAALKAIYPA
ncbi:MAG: hypothetical protein A3E78_12295 [Alphaproteobacteria bacterium RIFCSPHIGHO2_12_FULL_63_12]|nr:MAG: hypothetical protein A3E78_12295 [Alphaproteobacteria bacterium RIFCSPHIGHO2_12_FULL_63_12]